MNLRNMSETITPDELEAEIRQEFGEPGPEREMRMLLHECDLFRQRTEKLIPEAEIIDIRIGYVKSIEEDTACLVLYGQKNETEIDRIEKTFGRDYATRHGRVVEGLPVAFVVYRDTGTLEYCSAVIPHENTTPTRWVMLRPDFDYSRFRSQPTSKAD